jgi:hypothetical protein
MRQAIFPGSLSFYFSFYEVWLVGAGEAGSCRILESLPA